MIQRMTQAWIETSLQTMKIWSSGLEWSKWFKVDVGAKIQFE